MRYGEIAKKIRDEADRLNSLADELDRIESATPKIDGKADLPQGKMLISIKEASYNKLRKLLSDRKMSTADLRKATGIAPNTLTKLRRDEAVTLDVLGRICEKLNVNIGDIMEFIYQK